MNNQDNPSETRLIHVLIYWPLLQKPKTSFILIFPSHSLSRTSELLAKYVVHQQPCAALFRHTRPFFAKPLLLAFTYFQLAASTCSLEKMPWFPCKINFSLPLWLFLDFPSKYNTYLPWKYDYAINDFIVLSKSHAKTVWGPKNLPMDRRSWGRFCRSSNSLPMGFTFLMDANTSKYI